ncbi:MAG: hypothetical protein PHC28_05160 [Flavobacterium sp.]|uniref:hypothetical protein n=1 Tax=Flavobacterium sp. TaxID=239 RepID=UPI00262B7BB9|nr:hypothetical protein [Flavobacterium sp.]MDD5149855.1 hypothetical protein [Flavobacterium sp.]
MAENILSRITTLLNRMVDVISQGNFERVSILRQMNLVFKEAYFGGELERYCKVSTSSGNPSFKHELSSFYMRSGFKITIENDANLTVTDFIEISRYVIDSKPFVRQLMAYGYDTLIISGRTVFKGHQISLKEISNFQDYMLNG